MQNRSEAELPRYCYLAKGAKQPSHTTNMLITTKYNQMKIIADMEIFRRIEWLFSFFDDLIVRRIEVAPRRVKALFYCIRIADAHYTIFFSLRIGSSSSISVS